VWRATPIPGARLTFSRQYAPLVADPILTAVYDNGLPDENAASSFVKNRTARLTSSGSPTCSRLTVVRASQKLVPKYASLHQCVQSCDLPL
jgi:hypothetical protein